MMKCPNCESIVEDNATSCWNCFVEFRPSDGTMNPVLSVYSPQPRKRPDGSVLLGLGSALLVIAAMLFLVAIGGNGSGSSDIGTMARSWTLTLLAGGSFQLGLILTLAGVIVRAMWFLPGDEEKIPSRPGQSS